MDEEQAELDYERKKIAFCQESLVRIRDMAPPHSAIVAHIDVLLAFLRRTAPTVTDSTREALNEKH